MSSIRFEIKRRSFFRWYWTEPYAEHGPFLTYHQAEKSMLLAINETLNGTRTQPKLKVVKT